MKYVASRKINGVKWLVLLLYVLGIGLFLLPSYIEIPFGAILQIGGIVSLAFAIQFTIRYMLTSYTYEIYDYASEASLYPILNIYRTQGQRSTLLGSVGFEDMVDLEHKPKIEDGVTKAANYCPEFRAKDVYRIRYMDGDKEKALYLQCDKAFAAAVSERIALYGKGRETIED